MRRRPTVPRPAPRALEACFATNPTERARFEREIDLLKRDIDARNEKLKEEGTISDVQSKQTDTQAKAAQAQLAMAKAGLAQARLSRSGQATCSRRRSTPRSPGTTEFMSTSRRWFAQHWVKSHCAERKNTDQ